MSGELETVEEYRCFGGTQGIYRHSSKVTQTMMQFSVFMPPGGAEQKKPALWFLSGLTCSEENFTVKSGAQQFAADSGMILIVPDTSPRGAGIEGEDDSYDFGTGAGFYLDATASPWKQNYRMYSYIVSELQRLAVDYFPIDVRKQGITGHSMGGHGALTIALKNPQRYQSVSAFAPICAPMQCPWGQKAFRGYLGEDRTQWSQYDAVELIKMGHRCNGILVDQGRADQFLDDQLMPDRLSAVCTDYGQPLQLRKQTGYDHSYYFIASFIEDHIRFHAANLHSGEYQNNS